MGESTAVEISAVQIHGTPEFDYNTQGTAMPTQPKDELSSIELKDASQGKGRAARSHPDADMHTALEELKSQIGAECRAEWKAKLDTLESRVLLIERTSCRLEGAQQHVSQADDFVPAPVRHGTKDRDSDDMGEVGEMADLRAHLRWMMAQIDDLVFSRGRQELSNLEKKSSMSELVAKVEGISRKSSVALERVQKLESDVLRLQPSETVALQASEMHATATCKLPASPQLPPAPPLPPATTKTRRPHLLAKEAGDGGDYKESIVLRSSAKLDELMARLARLEGIISGTTPPVPTSARLDFAFHGNLRTPSTAPLSPLPCGELILAAAAAQGGNDGLGGEGYQEKFEDSTMKLQEDSLWVLHVHCTHLFVARHNILHARTHACAHARTHACNKVYNTPYACTCPHTCRMQVCSCSSKVWIPSAQASVCWCWFSMGWCSWPLHYFSFSAFHRQVSRIKQPRASSTGASVLHTNTSICTPA